MIGTEFVQDRETKEPATALRNDIERSAFQRGLLTLACGRSTLRFAPALMIPKPLVDEGLQVFEDCVTEAEKKHKMI